MSWMYSDTRSETGVTTTCQNRARPGKIARGAAKVRLMPEMNFPDVFGKFQKKKFRKIDKKFEELGHFGNFNLSVDENFRFEIINIGIINIFEFSKMFEKSKSKNVNNFNVNNLDPIVFSSTDKLKFSK